MCLASLIRAIPAANGPLKSVMIVWKWPETAHANDMCCRDEQSRMWSDESQSESKVVPYFVPFVAMSIRVRSAASGSL